MRRHVRDTKRCKDSELVERHGTVVFDDHENLVVDSASMPRTKPGPKTLDIAGFMSDRVAAYDEGDDDRIDHLFETSGLLDSFFDLRSVRDVAPFLFKNLWGSLAPQRLRSFGRHRNSIFEVVSDGAVSDRGPLRKKLVREMIIYIHEFARTILTVCVPARCSSEGMHRADRLLSLIDETFCGGVTIRDALERSDTYVKERNQTFRAFIDSIEGTMLAEFSRHVWTPYCDL